MSKLTAQDIQVFVGGAFALAGFYGVFWLPYYFVAAPDTSQIISHAITALSLPLGIGMLIGSRRAMLLAHIYLWVVVVSGCIAIPLVCFALPSRTAHLILRYNVDFISSIILLWLMVWSRSKRFQREPGA